MTNRNAIEGGPLLDGLNPPQREAVLQTQGPVLILAGAGSGKTRVITRRIAYLVRKAIADPTQILAMTFTNKAAEEMRERVAEQIGQKLAKGLTLTTFHSFCVRVLRAHIDHIGYRRNFTISADGDTRTLMRRVLGDIDGPKDTFSPQTIQAAISLHKSTRFDEPLTTEVLEEAANAATLNAALNATDPEVAAAAAKAAESETAKKYRTWLPEIYERYQSALRAANSVDFDDLLNLTLTLWREHPKVLAQYQQQFQYVMVDEYQDTNRIQYQLLRALVDRHRNLCVVGDDDQSIYGWRGADVRNILDFEQDFPEARIITLDQNYRSTDTILKAANAVIANNKVRREKNLWSNLEKGRAIDWVVAADEEHEAKTAVAWLQFIQEKTNAPHSDFAVLYRSTLQSRPLELAFRQAGIPYAVFGGQDFFERTEVKDIVAYLKLVTNPRDEAAFLRVVNVPRRGIGDAALVQIHELCLKEQLPLAKAMHEALQRGLVSHQAAGGIRVFLEILRVFRTKFKDRTAPLTHLVKELIEQIGYRDELVRTSKTPEQYEFRWDNVQAVVRAVEAYETASSTPTLTAFLDDNALGADSDRPSKDERRQTGVNLMTIHSAKGLEFPFVFIVGCEEGLLPHERSVRDSAGAVDEERRLFYVALTRGQRHVTLFQALSRNRFGKERMTQASRFLKEIPEALLCTQVRAVREMVEERVAPPPEKKPAKPKAKRRVRRS